MSIFHGTGDGSFPCKKAITALTLCSGLLQLD